MLRSADDAKAFAEDIVSKSEDEVADEAPLSMSDMQKPAETPVKKVDVGGVIDGLKQKGETKLSDHAEPVEQPRPRNADGLAMRTQTSLTASVITSETILAKVMILCRRAPRATASLNPNKWTQKSCAWVRA